MLDINTSEEVERNNNNKTCKTKVWDKKMFSLRTNVCI